MANDQDDPNKNKPKRRVIITRKPQKSSESNPFLPHIHEVIANPVTSEDLGIPIFKRPKASIKKALYEPIPDAIKPKQAQASAGSIPSSPGTTADSIPSFKESKKTQKTSKPDASMPAFKGPPRARMNKSSHYFFNLLSLVAIFGVAFLGFWVFSQQTQQSKVAEKAANFENTIAQLRTNISNQTKNYAQLEDKLQELTDILNEQNRRLAQLGAVHKWNVFEARYLTSLAIERVAALADIETAIQLLKSADEKVKVMADPRLIAVRESLAQDIALLQNAPRVDIFGLWARTGALSNQLSNLSFFKPAIAAEASTTNESLGASSKNDSSNWRDALYASWGEIKGLIRVREFDPKSFAAILSGKEQQQLLFNLKLLIEQARWGIVQQNETIYKNSLTTLQQWLLEYFVKNENLEKLLQEIAQLHNTSITTPVPQIHASLDAIDQYLNTQTSASQPNEATQ